MQENLASPWGSTVELVACRAAMGCRRPDDQMENLKCLLGLAGMELLSPQHPRNAGQCIGTSKGPGNTLY